ncbi:hypothetical protein Gogos_000713 [Gossypium gossypioides]|uniref:Uncharacterized protein n=1 Tax=Gossypium gossypioides TaxID=34282 RepID=A0A7J9CTL8_GOSGO|nr:hypothetical protein [Gossypium gossypioides]
MWSHLWRIYLGKLLEIKGVVEVYIPYGDSHSVVAIRNKLMVYGGDCGDRYHGDVDVFNKDNSIWSRLTIQGSLPGVGAGHVVVSIRTKVFIIGGTGDKHYYNNVWVLDHLSPSQSNQEQALPQKATSHMVSHGLNLFKPLHHIPSNFQLNSVPNNRKGIKYMVHTLQQNKFFAVFLAAFG